jgi:Flp pilus assembly pilin Flp
MSTIVRFIRHPSGASAVEYGLIAAAAGLAVAAVMPILASS